MTERLPVLLAWSGGKDAAWTLHTLRRRDDVEGVGLLTTVTREYDRVSMQGIRRTVLHAQAQATGLPLIEATIPAHCINDDYERAMAAALAYGVSVLASSITVMGYFSWKWICFMGSPKQ